MAMRDGEIRHKALDRQCRECGNRVIMTLFRIAGNHFILWTCDGCDAPVTEENVS